MGFFELFFGNDNERNRKHREQEMANVYDFVWDEPEETKCDKFDDNYRFLNYFIVLIVPN